MMNINKLRIKEIKARFNHKCEHGHNGLTHPACYTEDNLRICYFDLEATNLKATFGIMLSTAIKEQDNKNIILNHVEYPLHKQYDRQVIIKTLEALKQFDVVVTYYGHNRRFDLPFLRTRAAMLKLHKYFPKYGSMVSIDLYTEAKNLLSLPRYRLDAACEVFQIHGKTHLKGSIWVAAMCGDESALEYIIEHNKQDVIILEKLHKEMDMYMPRKKTSI